MCAWAVTAVVGSSLVGALVGSQATKSAAQTSADALAASTAQQNQANATQLQLAQDATAKEQPWMTAGTQALQTMQSGLAAGGQFDPAKQFTLADAQLDPSYDFALQKQQGALEASAAARGMQMSGAQIQGTQENAQANASTQYQQAYTNWQNQQSTSWNRLMGVSNQGQAAASNQAGVLQQEGVNTVNNAATASSLTLGAAQNQNNLTMANAQIAGNVAGTVGQVGMASLFAPTTPTITPGSDVPATTNAAVTYI